MPASRPFETDSLSARASQYTMWRAAVLLIVLVTVLRLVYLIWLSPWQLLGDEAYYWVQSQHPSLSYVEKGPLLAWVLWLCCRIFGSSEWVVRLPVALASALSAWGIGKIALNVTRSNQLAGFLAVVVFLLIPAFQANAQISTQDGILILFFVALTAAGLRLVRRWELNRSTAREWILFYMLLGLGVLLKQSIVLFMSAFAVYAILRRRHLKWSAALVAYQIVGALIVSLIATPMLVWERRNGWPMLHHTIGHLGFGGDQAGEVAHGNPFFWLLNTTGSCIGAIGPAIVVMVWASLRAWKNRFDDDHRWRDRLWLMCAAWPGVLFYVVLSLTKPVVPSWPLPSFVPLVALAADVLSTRVGTGAAMRAIAVYGICSALLLADPMPLQHLPVFGPKIRKSLLSQLVGHRDVAARVSQTIVEHPNVSMVVAAHYQPASLLSFYLGKGPPVTTAGSFIADRLSNFDIWPDTALDNPAQRGRDMLLIGSDLEHWTRGLSFERIEPIGNGWFIGMHYQGVRVPRVDRRKS